MLIVKRIIYVLRTTYKVIFFKQCIVYVNNDLKNWLWIEHHTSIDVNDTEKLGNIGLESD